MNIIKEIGDNIKYNFHSHTQFCDGRAAMADFVEEAVAQGFTHYGFSPHSPVPIVSPCNMSQDDVPAYLAECTRLKLLWRDKINLYSAMEIDYLGAHWGPSHDYFRNLPLDYRIGSVHFIPSDSGYVDVDGSPQDFVIKMDKYFHRDLRYVVNTFYKQTIAMLNAGGFDIIGHFDKIGFNASNYQQGVEQEKWYRDLVLDVIDLIAEKNVVAEINTKAWDTYQRLFPGKQWLDYVKHRQIKLIVNSDAHFPHLINAGREEGLKIRL